MFRASILKVCRPRIDDAPTRNFSYLSIGFVFFGTLQQAKKKALPSAARRR